MTDRKAGYYYYGVRSRPLPYLGSWDGSLLGSGAPLAARIADTQQRQQQETLLGQVARHWGRKVRHVFDRGYGNGPWLWQLWRVRYLDCALFPSNFSRHPTGRNCSST